MIKQLRCQNYKSLYDLTIDFSPFTVFVGPNAGGKSTVLEALSLFGRLARPAKEGEIFPPGHPGRVLGDRAQLLQRSTHQQGGVLAAEATTEAGRRLTISGTSYRQGQPTWRAELDTGSDRKTLEFGLPEDGIRSIAKTRKAPEELLLEALPIMPGLTDVDRLRLDPALLAQSSASDLDVPRMADGGAGLPSLLAHLAAVDLEVVEAICRDLAAVVPGVRRVRMPRARIVVWQANSLGSHKEEKEVWGHSLEVEFGRSGFLPATDISEGTLISLGLLTWAHSNPQSTTLLIDDLDRALHPRAQVALVAALRRLVETRPRLQIVATTHSSFLLDSFAPEEVRVIHRDAAGHANCRPLPEHPEMARWQGTLRSGEFWSMVGERWVVEGVGE